MAVSDVARIVGNAGLVVGRAIIRDRFHGPEAQRLMSQNHARLRHCAGARARRRRCVAEYFRSAIPTLNFAAIFIYVAAAPTSLVDLLGVSTYGFAWHSIPLISGIMTGAVLSGRLAGRLSPRRTISPWLRVHVRRRFLNLLAVAFVPPIVPWHVLPLFVFTMGTSIVMPSLTLLLVHLFPAMRGLLSSLAAFVQFVFSGSNAGTIAPFLAHSLSLLASGMAGLTVASFALW